jgi:hypothetical protein
MAKSRGANRSLSRANSDMLASKTRRGTRRSLPSVIMNARSSRPTSILGGGKQYFGPLYNPRKGFDT